MTKTAINLQQKLRLFDDCWSPKVIAELNDYQFKLSKFEGEFVWHKHDDTDEAFLCLEGEFEIRLRDGNVRLGPGELFVVPRGVEHLPAAIGKCSVLLIEPRGVVNTGDDAGDDHSDRRAENDVWI